MRKLSTLALLLGVVGLALAPAVAFSDCGAEHSIKVSSTTTTSGQSTGDGTSIAEQPTTNK